MINVINNHETTIINGGIGNDTVNLKSNSALTTINGNDGNETFNVMGTGATTTINGNNGNDVFNVRAIGSATELNGGNNNDTFNVGSKANGTLTTTGSNSGGNVNGISAVLTVNGDSTTGDVLNVDDTGSTTAKTDGVLTPTALTGLGMSGSITYGTVEALNVSLGTIGNIFDISDTNSSTVTTINSGGGNDRVTLTTDSGITTINGQSGIDEIDVMDTDATTTINAGEGNDTITLTDSHAMTTINGNNGNDTITLMDSHAMTTINGNNGNDIFKLTDNGAATTINGNNGNDTFTLTDTGATTTINGNNGNDVFNVRAIGSATELNGGNNNDTFNVGSKANGTLTTTGSNSGGNVNGISAVLTVNGDTSAVDRDVLNVDETGETGGSAGFLNSTMLTGLGMTGRVEYDTLELLDINLGPGSDQFTISDTYSYVTVLNSNSGLDRIAVKGVSGLTTVNAGADNDTIYVGSNATLAATPNLDTNSGGNVNSISALLTINGDDNGSEGPGDVVNVDETGDLAVNDGTLTTNRIWGLGMPESTESDNGITYETVETLNLSLGKGLNTFNVQSTSPTTTTTLNTLSAGTGEGGSVINVGSATPSDKVDEIRGTLNLVGSGTDTLNVDDTGSTVHKDGTLTANTLTGLAMGDEGIQYSGVRKLNISLGTGRDHFYIESTPDGTTTVLNTGDEPAVGNQITDIVNINSIDGPTAINAGAGNDVLRVNYDIDGNQTFRNGIDPTAPLTLHGNAGSDLYEIGLAGSGEGVSNIYVDDVSNDGRPNRLKIYGTQREDLFLFRPKLVAALGVNDDGTQTGTAEKIYYESSINDVAVYGGDADDTFVLDDTSSPITIYGDAGNDLFQVGQVFQSPRNEGDPNNGLAREDYFGTIQTTRGWLSNGNGRGNPTTIYGGIGNDSFTVYRNLASLFLFGEEGDDSFTVRAFVKVDPNDPKAPSTNINGGQGADFISYTVNAPVNIEGGDGFDSLTVLGTEFGDDFVVTDRGVLGAGLFIRYGGLERIVVNALEGNDTFFILSSAEGVALEVYGGLGSDTFKVGGGDDGKAITVVANDLLGHSGLILHETDSSDPRYLGVFAHGVSANVTDSDAPGVFIDMSSSVRVFENSAPSNSLVQDFYTVVLSRSPVDTVVVSAVPTLSTRADQLAGGEGVFLSKKESDADGLRDGVSLLFDRTNWFIPQKVYVRAPDDSLSEGLRTVNIQHSVKQGVTSDDGDEYDNLSLPTVVAEVVDDDAAGVLVVPAPDGNVVAEAGRHASSSDYQVVLTRKPAGEVVVELGHDSHLMTMTIAGSGGGALPTSSGELVFTPDNWSTPQTITITAVDDGLPTGLIYSRISHQLDLGGVGSLENFYGLTAEDVTDGLAAKIAGDSNAQFTITPDPTDPLKFTITAPGNVPINAQAVGASPEIDITTGSVSAASVAFDPMRNVFTTKNPHGLAVGVAVKLGPSPDGALLPDGFIAGANYYVSLLPDADENVLFTVSQSKQFQLSFTPGGPAVTATSESGTFTFVGATGVFTSDGHDLAAGDVVRLSFDAGGALPEGLSERTDYHVISAPDLATFTVSETSGGPPVTATSDGTGNLTWTLQEEPKNLEWSPVGPIAIAIDFSGIPRQNDAWQVILTTSTVQAADFLDFPALATVLKSASRPIDTWLKTQLATETTDALMTYVANEPVSDALKALLVRDFNAVIMGGQSIYDDTRFTDITLSEETMALQALANPTVDELVNLNRSLLVDAYPLSSGSMTYSNLIRSDGETVAAVARDIRDQLNAGSVYTATLQGNKLTISRADGSEFTGKTEINGEEQASMAGQAVAVSSAITIEIPSAPASPLGSATISAPGNDDYWLKKVALSGTVADGSVWTLILEEKAYDYTANQVDGLSLNAVAKGLQRLLPDIYGAEVADGTSIIELGPEGSPAAFTFEHTPDAFTSAGHGLAVGDVVRLSFDAGGALPEGLSERTNYHVLTVTDSDTFTLSATTDGAPVAATSNGAGDLTWSRVTPPFTVGFTFRAPGIAGQNWQVSLNGTVYTYTGGDNGENTSVKSVDVKVLDQAVAGVFVQETGGSTDVIEPTDIVLLGVGQVKESTSSAAAIHLETDATGPAIVGSVSITSSTNSVSDLQRTLSGTQTSAGVWRNLSIALGGELASEDTITLTLKAVGDGTEEIYTATGFTDLKKLADDLVVQIKAKPPATAVFTTVASSKLTQFVGDFGDSEMNEMPSHDSFLTAQPIDFGSWGTSANPDIKDADTIPHLTIKGTGNGETDWYKFVITQTMLDKAGGSIDAIFDIDHGFDGTGILWGSYLKLYQNEVTVDGQKVTPLETSKQPESLDPGSSSTLDGLLEYTFDNVADANQGDTYWIEVINFLGPKYSFSRSIGLPNGISYDLNVSIPGHDVADFIFDATPVRSTGGDQNVDDAKLWFTVDNPDIGDDTSVFNSGVPYVIIHGTGSGMNDEYRFRITGDMLESSASDLTGDVDSRTYYTSADVALAGPVGVGDQWSVTINGPTSANGGHGNEFVYTVTADDVLDAQGTSLNRTSALVNVAAGLVGEYQAFVNTPANLALFATLGFTAPTYTITNTAETLQIADANGFTIDLEQTVVSAATVTRTLSTVSDAKFDTVELALSGTPAVGESWSVLIDGVGTLYTHTVTASGNTVQTLGQVGQALAAIDGDASYANGLLTIKGLGILNGGTGAAVSFAISGSSPTGTAVISGTGVQDAAVNAKTSSTVESDLVTEATVQFGGTVAHNQAITLTLRDSQGALLGTSTLTVGQSNGVVETLTKGLEKPANMEGFSAISGFTLTPNGTALDIIPDTAGTRFTVDVTIVEAPHGESQTTTSTPPYYSRADIALNGTPHLGEKWSIQVTQQDGTTIDTYDYVVGDSDSKNGFDGVVDSDGDLTGDSMLSVHDVAEGLKRVIGSIASRDGSLLTLTKAEGIKVDLLPVMAAPRVGDIAVGTSSVHSLVNATIDLTGLAVSKGQKWTLTLDGQGYEYTTATTGITDIDNVGNALATVSRNDTTPRIPAGFSVAYSSNTLTITGVAADFTVALDNGAPAASYKRHATEWAVLNLDFSSTSIPLRLGELWTLALNGGPAESISVGPNTSLHDVAAYFQGKFHSTDPSGFTVTQSTAGSAQRLNVVRNNGSAFSALFSVAAPVVSGAMNINATTSDASHWSTANIQLADFEPVNLGETWNLTLTRPDGTVVAGLSYVVADTVADGVIDLKDVAKGFADLINDPALAMANVSVLTYNDVIGVTATVTVTPAPVATTASVSGTFAGKWEQTIQFTGGGTGGVSAIGNQWTITADGTDYDFTASAAGFSEVASGSFSDDVNPGNLLTSDYTVNPSGSTLVLSAEGELIDITKVQQVRDRKAELVTGVEDTITDTDSGTTTPRTHFTTATLALDQTLTPVEGEIWQVVVNGHTFQYTVESKKNINGVAKGLAAEINGYGGNDGLVYSAVVPSGSSTITITPGSSAWFTGMVVDSVQQGDGTVTALFDIDHGNEVRGILYGTYSYTDRLSLDVYKVLTNLDGSRGLEKLSLPIATTYSGGGLDSGSRNQFDPFKKFKLTEAAEYLVRVSSERTYDILPDYTFLNEGVTQGLDYQLNISVQRHATNEEVINLVGKQISIVDGAGKGQTGKILAYDVEGKIYTVDKVWKIAPDASSKFKISYHIADEFSVYEPNSDSYTMVLTSAPTGNVTVDVLSQLTGTYNSDLAFVSEANFGKNSAIQVLTATPQAVVELAGTPLIGQRWTVNLNGVNYGYDVKAQLNGSAETLEMIAQGLADLIYPPDVRNIPPGGEHYIANSNGSSITILSSVYDDLITGILQTGDATPFTVEFAVAASPGSAVINAISENKANVELEGVIVDAGSVWTLHLDGADYSYMANIADGLTLNAVANGLKGLLPQAYVATVAMNSSILELESSLALNVSFRYMPAVFLDPAGRAQISDPDGVSGWFNADVTLEGLVDLGSVWTLRLDDTNYNYTANVDDGLTLNAVANGLFASLPSVYKGTGAGVIGTAGMFHLTKTTEQFKVSFSYTQATVVRPQLVFTPTTWDVVQTVVVTAIDDNVVDGGDAKVVPAEDSRINTIRGPLTIDGGDPVGQNTDLNKPYLLPGEKNSLLADGNISTFGVDADGNAYITDSSAIHVNPRSTTGVPEPGFDPRMNSNFYQFTILTGDAAGAVLRVKSVSADLTTVTFDSPWPDEIEPAMSDAYYYAPINPNVLVNEADQVDVAHIDNSNSPAAETGVLTGFRLTGFGMGGDTVIGPKTLQGGIGYNNLELLDLSLGFGSNNLTIESSHTGTTVIDSGAGNDVFNVETLVGHTSIDTGSGTDVVNVGSDQQLINEIGGLLKISSSPFATSDFLDFSSLAGQLKNETRPIDTWLKSQLAPETQDALGNYSGSGSVPNSLKAFLMRDFNSIVNGLLIYDGTRFADVTMLRGETQLLLSLYPHGGDLLQLNTMLIEDAYPSALSQTPKTPPILNINDSGNTIGQVGILTPTTLTGFGMPGVSEVQMVSVLAAGGTFRLSYSDSNAQLTSSDRPSLSSGSVFNYTSLAVQLLTKSRPVDLWLEAQLAEDTLAALAGYTGPGPISDFLKSRLERDITGIIDGTSIDTTGRFDDITLSLVTEALRADPVNAMDVKRLNSLLIADAYPLQTEPLGYDISAGDLQRSLNALLGSTGVRVEKHRDSTKTVTYTIIFGGDLAGRNLEQLEWSETRDSTGLRAAAESFVNVEVANLRDGTTTPNVNTVQTFTVNATSGTFTLEFQLNADAVAAITTDLTVPIPFNASAEELARYIEPILNPANSDGGLPHTENVAVEKVGNVFIITFQGEHRGSRVASVDTTNLINGAGAAAGTGTIDVATRMHEINYYGIESLNLELGSGDDVLNVPSTHAGETTIRAGAGSDLIKIETLAGHTFIYLGEGSDTIKVGTARHLLDKIDGLLTVIGGGANDTLLVDDSLDPSNNTGTLDQTTLTGLDMQGVSEVQVMTVQAIGGDFYLNYTDSTGTLTTGALSYNISEGDLASELNTLLGSTGIHVGKYRDSAQNVTYTVTFGGDLAGRDMEQLKWSETVDTSNLIADKGSSVKVDVLTQREGILAPVLNTVQTFSINATSGTFKLKFLLSRDMLDAINQGISGVDNVYVPKVTDSGTKGYVTTAELAYDITAEELAKYLDPILNPRNSNDRVSHTRNFSIHQVGDVFLITLKGEHRDSRVAEVDTSGLDGTVDVATRTHGINYYGIESLNIELGSGDDVFNVQGTSAVTSLNTHAGQDQIFVSSNANENQVTRSSSFQAGNAIRFSGDDQPVLTFELSEIASSVIIEIRDSSGTLVRAMELTIAELDLLSAATGSYKTVWDGRDDALQLAVPGAYNFSVVGVRSDGSKFAGLISQTGTLDDVDGELNIDAGTETNLLMVSDIGSPNGDTSGLITDSQISGLAEADINFITTGLQMPNDGLYSEFEEVSIQLGTGHDRLLIENTHAGKTMINTGAGDDRIAIASTSGNLHLKGDAGNDTVRIATSDFDGNLASDEGFVETIMGHLIFDGGEGEDLMTVSDSNDSTSETGTLTESSLTGFGFNSAPEVQTLTVIGQSGFYRISRGDVNVPWYSIRPGVARPGALGVALDVRFTAAQVQEHLEFVYGFGNVSVDLISEEVGTKKYEITFISELAGADIAPIRWADPGPINLVATADSERAEIIIGIHTPAVKKPSVANTQQFLEIINADRGSFTITLLDQSTEPLPFDITLEALMNALKPILNPNNSNPSKPYHNNFDIEKIDRKFLITFKGEHRDLSIAGVDIDVTDLRGGSVNLVTRESGLSYFNLEQLDLSLGDGIDVLNVQGTSATTNIDLGGGDDELYVSSLSDIDFVKRDHSFIGNLDGIGGTLNIDGGSGDQKLLISDASSMDGDFVSIIDRLPLRNLLEKYLNRSSELFIIGASPAPISIQADQVDGSFRKGFRIETGAGDDTINVTATIFRNRIVDAGKFDLDTGLGNDNVFASLTADGNSPLIINTESEFNYRMIMRSVPNLADLTNPEDNVLVIVDGVRLSSDQFRVVNELNAIDLKIDGDLSADTLVEVQVSRVSRGRVAEVPGQRQYTIDYQLHEGETVKLFSAGEELIQGVDYFFYQIRPQRFILVFNGRFNFFRNGDIIWEATRIFSEFQTVQSMGQRDDDFVNASGSTLPLSIFTGSGNDVVIGGQGDDIINSGRGDDVVFGRSGSDQIISVEGNQLDEDFDIIFGDDGIAKFKHFPREVTIDSRNAAQQRLPVGDYRLSEVFSVEGGTAGDDVITSGNGDDILIGGFGADQLRSGDGSDILVGDSGRVVFELGNLLLIESMDSFDQSGTNDVLSGGDGVNYLIGGLGNDEILTGFTDGSEFSLILGDLGEISFSYNASTGINSVTGMASSFPGIGGDDKVSSSGSSDWIIAGSGMDQLVIPYGAFFTLGIGSFTPAFANDVLYYEWIILRSLEDSTGGRIISLDGYSLEQRTRLIDHQQGVFYER